MPLGVDADVVQGITALFSTFADRELPAPGDLQGRRDLIAAALSSDEPLAPGVQLRDVRLEAFDGAEISGRWYATPESSSRAAVLYVHGGGMIGGSIDHYDSRISQYVVRSGVSMLAVEYRLAPEHPFPIPQEDCYVGLCWLADHAEELGLDRRRFAVMGDSAGGGLAAAVAILARDRGGPRLARQVLIYAMLDDRTLTPDEHLLQAPLLVHGYEDNLASWNALLDNLAGAPEISPVAAPARLESAVGLPSAYVEVGDVDIFRAENVEYARKLSGHGVPVALHVHAGAPHGYDLFAPGAAVSQRAVDERIRVLGEL